MDQPTLVAKIRMTLNYPGLSDAARLANIEAILDEERDDFTTKLVTEIFLEKNGPKL